MSHGKVDVASHDGREAAGEADGRARRALRAAKQKRRRRTRLVLGLGGLALIVAAVTSAVVVSSGGPTGTIPLLNLPVPTFHLPNLRQGGPVVSKASLRKDAAVVVNFWGSWCPPCTREMPALQAAHRALGSQVTFVGIDEEDTRAAALAFLHRVGTTYSSGFDPSGALGRAFELNGTPTTFFLAHGRMLDFHLGGLTEGALLRFIRQIYGITPTQ